MSDDDSYDHGALLGAALGLDQSAKTLRAEADRLSRLSKRCFVLWQRAERAAMDDDAGNAGKDATAFCGEDVAVYCASCGAKEIAPDVYDHTPSCVLSARAVAPPPRPRSVAHATEPMPNAAMHDEPPSRPL